MPEIFVHYTTMNGWMDESPNGVSVRGRSLVLLEVGLHTGMFHDMNTHKYTHTAVCVHPE